jgi:hypothetical protein
MPAPHVRETLRDFLEKIQASEAINKASRGSSTAGAEVVLRASNRDVTGCSTYLSDGGGRVAVATDARQDRYGTRTIHRQRCTDLLPVTGWVMFDRCA